MKKLMSLLRACMTDGMNLFKINGKKNSNLTKKVFPIFIVIIFFVTIWYYAEGVIGEFAKVNLEFVMLTLFVALSFILTLIEGIYKSSSLLFNCKDDNLILSLPIKKSTVLFVRVFKFYIFEVMYNALLLVPAMCVYARHINVGTEYYIVSLFAILLLPIIPIVISCIVGGIISISSSKFRFKNIVQIIITTVFLLGVFYLSYNIQSLMESIAQNGIAINNIITKIYYSAGAYIKLITNFNVKDLLIFISVNLGLLIATVLILSKVYFKINSRVKSVKTKSKSSKYRIKTKKPMSALIKKELKKFLSSPVFVTNAAFGLVLFVVVCVLISIKFDSIVEMLKAQQIDITIEQIRMYMPTVLFGFVCFASLMSSITSSMISLEGKAFNILKSLPVKPFKIILSKILTAVFIMIPFILIGDIIVFIRFSFNVFEIIMILASSIILPLISETLGMLINLKYPKMEYTNDAEVVKQSMSSMIAVFAGMALVGLTIFILFKCIFNNIPSDKILLYGLGIYALIYLILLTYLNKKSVKAFNSINV